METNKPSPVRALYKTGMILAVVGTILATLLVCKHLFHGICSGSMGCDISGVDGCSRLGSSPYSKLFGVIPIAIPGLFYYVFMGSLFFSASVEKDQKRRAGLHQVLFGFAVFGFVFDLILAYVNLVVLPVPCLLCVYTYPVTIGFLILSFLIYRKESAGSEGESAAAFFKHMSRTFVQAIAALAVTGIVLSGFYLASQSVSSEEASSSSSLLSSDQVPEYLSDFGTLKMVQIPVEGLMDREGDDRGYIVIQKFFDFRCPHCYDAGIILDEALRRWPGRILIYYRHFPLDGTCNRLVSRPQEGAYSCNGAQAALCAPEQGIFVPFFHGLFHFQDTNTMISLDSLRDLTQKLGGNWPRMVQCMGSSATARALDRDLLDAEHINVRSTPTIVVNGHLLPAGTPDRAYFLHLMDALVYQKEGKAAYDDYMARIAAAGQKP